MQQIQEWLQYSQHLIYLKISQSWTFCPTSKFVKLENIREEKLFNKHRFATLKLHRLRYCWETSKFLAARGKLVQFLSPSLHLTIALLKYFFFSKSKVNRNSLIAKLDLWKLLSRELQSGGCDQLGESKTFLCEFQLLERNFKNEFEFSSSRSVCFISLCLQLIFQHFVSPLQLPRVECRMKHSRSWIKPGKVALPLLF